MIAILNGNLRETLKRNIETMGSLYAKLIFTALTFVIMIVSSCLYVRNIINNHLTTEAANLIDKTKMNIETELQRPQIILGLVSDHTAEIISNGGGEEEVLGYLRSVTAYIESGAVTSKFGYTGVFGYFDAYGGVYLDGSNWQPPKDYKPTERPWYKAAVEAEGRITLTTPYSDAQGGDTVITVSESLFDNKGKLLGVVGIDIPIKDVTQYLTVINSAAGGLSKDGYAVLTDSNSIILSHPSPEYIGVSLYNVASGFSEIAGKAPLDGGIIEREIRNYKDVDSIIFGSRLDNGWCLYVTTPRSEYYQELTDMALVISLLGALLAAALIVIIIRVDMAKQKSDQESQRKSIQLAAMDKIREATESASKAKTTFLANMSHEMRTPLNVIIGLSDLRMEDEAMAPDVRDDVRKINASGKTLLGLVNDVLDISKIEAGKLVLTPVAYTTASLLNDIVTLNMIRIESKPISLQTDISEDVFYELYGDELRVTQIFNNLLSNAIKYTREGFVKLTVGAEPADEGKDVWLSIEVSDSGIGIRPEDVKKLFSEYSQVDTRANRKIEGTGLGLAITKRIVELMGGTISVESEYGKGSVFKVRILQGYVSDKRLGADIVNKIRHFAYTDNKQHVSARLVRSDLSHAKVLVVDDFPTNLDVAAGMLRKYKMRVDCLTSGKAAVDRLKSGEPAYDAVFMDHMMPEMDGIEAVRQIRGLNSEYAQTVPIIALTANAIAGSDKLFLDNGFQEFLSKPIDILALDAVINKWIPKRKAEAVLPGQGSIEEQADGKTINIPGIDAEKALALYGGDTDLYLTILRSYSSNTPGVLDKLRAAAADNLGEYAVYAHGLKGASANIGAEGVRLKAERLEHAAKAGDLREVLAGNEPLMEQTEALLDALKTRLQEMDSAGGRERRAAPDMALLEKLRESCMQFDMDGIDETIDKLEHVEYDKDGELAAELRQLIDDANFAGAADRISVYMEKAKTQT